MEILYALYAAFISIVLIFLPLYPHHKDMSESESNDNSTMAKVLKDSNNFLIINFSCIVAIFPMAVDNLIDFFLKSVSDHSITDYLRERFIFVLSLGLPSFLFIYFRHLNIAPIVYLMLNISANNAVAAAVYNTVYRELHAKSKVILPMCYFISTLLSILNGVLVVYGMAFNWSEEWRRIFEVIEVICTMGHTVSFLRWLQLASNEKRFSDWLTIEEYSCLSYLLSFVAFSIAMVSLEISTSGFILSENHDENSLVSRVAIRFLFAVSVTVVPGCIARRLAIANMKSLGLKQVFVRYVSHEIRSPLNVVHAGLEILRSELNNLTQSATLQVNNSLSELMDDIYSASETAIEILNDLLHYEHMDAGTFNLELSWRPLAQLFQSKLHWAAILAEKNMVNLKIFDSTLASEFGVECGGCDVEGVYCGCL
mmetsp:Transcript_16561/g.24068  ORF Transcript_16561/g.24068 Transcript_16561/m.24068 type:complete len:426 (-) Transcript_16561:1005-2282(-)